MTMESAIKLDDIAALGKAQRIKVGIEITPQILTRQAQEGSVNFMTGIIVTVRHPEPVAHTLRSQWIP